MRGLRETKKGALVFGFTFPLLETASGHKMGKTEKGAMWLDAEKTSPYEMYQYWVNMDDVDIPRFLRMFTFLSLDEIEKPDRLEGAEIRQAKEILAFEATKIVHGEDVAREAQDASRAAFGGDAANANIPTTTISQSSLEKGVTIAELFVETGLVSSKGEARRLATQGGLYMNGQSVNDVDVTINVDVFASGGLVLRRGKKQHHRVAVE